ncbi:MAG TPA: hypothetical protein VM328_10930 [Fimbriimonadaceae bacterium]|nr:hypothetical protein [Fimbriimonadaceae bacterium]
MPDRYRKKPVVIEAVRIHSYLDLLPPAPWNDGRGGDVWRWLDAHGAQIICQQEDPGPAYGVIPTLEGPMRADVGDWIIRGVKGEFYPCDPDVFAATYEPVEEAS